MGFLESVGRSGAVGQLGQTIFNDTLAVGKLQQDAQENAIRQKLVDAKLAEQERLTRPVLLSEIIGKGSDGGRPNVMKVFGDAAKLAGAKKITLPDGTEDWTISQADLPNVQKFMEMQKEMRPQLMWATYQDNQQILLERPKQREKIKNAMELQAFDDETDKIKAENAAILTEFGKGNETKPSVLPPGAKLVSPTGDTLADNPKTENPIERDKFEETKRHNQAMEKISGQKIQGGKKELSFGDKEALRAMGKQLPKSKTAAETAVKNVQKIDRMLSLINQGAGGVKGELLAKINKVADALRVTPPEDAKYNTLKAELRGFAGQLRLQLGLVGQTSDRDVAIMYESAGGNAPEESQKAILNGYRQGYLQDITNFNSDATAYGEYSEAGKSLYKPIPVPEAPDPKMEWMKAAKGKNPNASEKELSDYYDKKYGGQ